MGITVDSSCCVSSSEASVDLGQVDTDKAGPQKQTMRGHGHLDLLLLSSSAHPFSNHPLSGCLGPLQAFRFLECGLALLVRDKGVASS